MRSASSSANLPECDCAGEGALDALSTRGERLVVSFDDHDARSRTRRDFGDARAHQTATYDTYSFHRSLLHVTKIESTAVPKRLSSSPTASSGVALR